MKNLKYVFFSAYDEKLVENVIETINPGILCCLNTNLADEVKISDVGRKGYGKIKNFDFTRKNIILS